MKDMRAELGLWVGRIEPYSSIGECSMKKDSLPSGWGLLSRRR